VTVQIYLSDKEFVLDKIEKLLVGQVGWYKSYSYKDEDGFEFRINQYSDEPKELKKTKNIDGKILDAIKIENGAIIYKYTDNATNFLIAEQFDIPKETKTLSDFEGTKHEIIISGHFSKKVLDKEEKAV